MKISFSLQKWVHDFAEDVVRPAARTLTLDEATLVLVAALRVERKRYGP